MEPLTERGSPISLHDVVEQRATVHWDEAVALVEEFCQVAMHSGGETAPVPDLEDVLFDANGSVTLRRTRGDRNPAAAGRMLHSLLSSGGDVPMALRLFVTQSTAHDANGSLREFARGLAYFGKPARQQLIRDLHARCVRAGRSTARPAAPPPLPHSETTADADRPQRPKRKSVAKWLFAAAALALASSGAWLWSSGRSTQDVEGSAATILSHASDVLVELGQQVRDTIGPAITAPAEAVTNANVDAERAPSTPRRSAPRTDSIETTPAPLVTRQPRRSARMLQLSLAVPNTVASEQEDVYEETAAPEAEQMPLYSSADPDVEPPVLVFPQLTPPPLFASTSTPMVNRMVVVVSADGTVERVQLVEGPARMIDMMLLSGAKAWKFTPAFKDGEPVRYQTVISWTVGP